MLISTGPFQRTQRQGAPRQGAPRQWPGTWRQLPLFIAKHGCCPFLVESILDGAEATVKKVLIQQWQTLKGMLHFIC